jgi:hypothetical protein
MSNYASFQAYYRDMTTGAITPVVSATVEVRDVTDDPACVRLADTASDADGVVPGASVAVAVGRLLRFTFKNANNGRCGSAVATTTA